MYETIEEEMSNASSPTQLKRSSPTTRQPIFIVDSDIACVDLELEGSTWDDERGITSLRKYYALRDEAETAVVESKRTWLDTPFSLFALQSRWFSFFMFLPCYPYNAFISFPSARKPRRDAGSSGTFCLKLQTTSF